MTTSEVTPVELPEHIYRQFEAEQDALARGDVDDFDAFWAERNPARPARICGVLVTPPDDVPLALVAKLDAVEGSTDVDAIREVLAIVYGPEVVARWMDAGIGIRRLGCVLAWTGAHMRGEPVDWSTAEQLATEAQTAAQARGKAGVNRAQRRSRKKSNGAGG